MVMQKKPNFDDLCEQYAVNDRIFKDLSRISGVAMEVLDSMLLDKPVDRSDAEKVLEAFSQNAKQTFTLDDVEVALLPDSAAQNQSEVALILQQIGDEYEAARRGLTGMAVVGKHAFITTRMENLGALADRLDRYMAHDDAMALVIERMDMSVQSNPS
jgi:hypothetical protein